LDLAGPFYVIECGTCGNTTDGWTKVVFFPSICKGMQMHIIVKEDESHLGMLNIKIGKKEHAILRDEQGRIVARFRINESCPLRAIPVIIEAPRNMRISRVQN
jgi:hypothetical protein